jgi:hypothetical protein
MAREDEGVRGEGEEPAEALEQVFFAAPGEVCAANTLTEEGVAGKEDSGVRVVEGGASGAVSGKVEYPEGAHPVPLLQEGGGSGEGGGESSQKRRADPQGFETPAVGLGGMNAQGIPVPPVDENGGMFKGGPKFREGHQVVKVTMGEEDIGGVPAPFTQGCDDPIRFRPGIDHQGGLEGRPLLLQGVYPAVGIEGSHIEAYRVVSIYHTFFL